MGLFFRKSKKLGLFRLNFSKSGVGVSVGVKGARIGGNAKGQTYVHAGRKGVYYRKTFSQAGGVTSSQPRARQAQLALPNLNALNYASGPEDVARVFGQKIGAISNSTPEESTLPLTFLCFEGTGMVAVMLRDASDNLDHYIGTKHVWPERIIHAAHLDFYPILHNLVLMDEKTRAQMEQAEADSLAAARRQSNSLMWTVIGVSAGLILALIIGLVFIGSGSSTPNESLTTATPTPVPSVSPSPHKTKKRR